MKLEGQCLCGNVTYAADTEPKFTAVCHCTNCQRQTGAGVSLVVGVDDADLVISGDSVKTFITVGEDHQSNTNRSFCGNCGSPIVSRIDAMPGLAFIKAGTLNDTSWLNPTLDLWHRSAQPWVPAIPGAEVFERGIPA
ncbi:GFA family protein [Microbacterium sp. 22303]|uniref:GFA family protein n=1 Tax=Microbacterium sp. 22303 TaxID=3453905 RepID=UPI003F86471C